MASSEKQLKDLRARLLALHQALLNYQRQRHEKKHGRVPTSGVMFTLAKGNKDFAWLRNLSELIVGLDGYLEQKEYSLKNTRSLIKYTKQLLQLGDHSVHQFGRLYYSAVQNDPEVLIAHHHVIRVLMNKK